MKAIAALALVAALAGRAGAVGLDGPAAADRRLGAGLAAGFDQVSGIDGHPFLEAFAHGEARVLGGLALGAALSLRGDVADYNYALARWRGGSAGLAAQVTVGYDGRWVHVGVGSWVYGDGRGDPRDGRRFRASFLPWGVLRVRAGALDGWHVNLRLLDGAPYTAEGGAWGLRLQLAAAPRGAHRLAAGIYASILESTAGIAFSDEIAGRGPAGTSVRVGGLVGTDYGHFGRPELTLFLGLVW